MGIIFSGGNGYLDKEAENKIVKLAVDELKSRHESEFKSSLKKFRRIVYTQEVSELKRYLESKHPEQVTMISKLRQILNHERVA